MAAGPRRVFTIAPSESFLDRLAAAILDGFPRETGAAGDPFDLARTTILLPTRRAARALERIFFEKSSGGLLLPRIRPIGDIDEDLFDGDSALGSGAAQAISPMGRELLLIRLVDDWAASNPQTRLAAEIAASPQHTINLARSLADLIDALETEELDYARLPDLYHLDFARHREAILEFLGIIREKLPKLLQDLGLMGPMARRSLVLREEAKRLAAAQPTTRVIAAGSTGSIPATRELLGVIASLPAGAVVLPGLDCELDDESWAAVNAQHPQYALKQLLDHLAVARDEVKALPASGRTARDRLLSETMRPPATAGEWTTALTGDSSWVTQGTAGVSLIEAADLREEAQVAALVMREALTVEGRTASLVTPDRDLARRVKQELAAFGITIDDSAGEPLIRFAGAALLGLLIDASAQEFAPPDLMALLRHPLCRFGHAPEEARRAVDVIELALFQGNPVAPAINRLAEALVLREAALKADPYRHRATLSIAEADWRLAADFAAKAAATLGSVGAATTGLADHLASLLTAAEAMAGEALWEGEAGATLRQLTDMLAREAIHLPACGFAQACGIIRHHLQSVALRNPQEHHNRLAILGLLEARLTRPDIVILGGLNEGRWPAIPQPGPWLNRPMRAVIGMEQPEREIGQTAHDFIQGLGAPKVHLLWAKRVGDQPAVPSRWVLRLKALLKAAGIDAVDSGFRDLARRLMEAPHLAPCAKPSPRPPVAARPKRLSVSRIETLIRDPYAIYARFVLMLEPLRGIQPDPGAAERGSLYHLAIGEFLEMFPDALPTDGLDRLMEIGRRHFTSLADDPIARTFWWPQFTRIARWFIAEEERQRRDIARVLAECSGRITLQIGGEDFVLSARADRIDIGRDGLARVIDYKTGKIPSGPQVQSGLAPQLTLEAAILSKGGFAAAGARETVGLSYVKLSGGDPAGQITVPKLDEPVMAVAMRHLANLEALLGHYGDRGQPYLPRAIPEKEDEKRDYDHLSRFAEWSLTGETP
jgi:ATP-dependent helicase/nuclease subunit B